MDNKEAIDAIKRNYPTENYTMLREALDMSIKSLEAAESQTTAVQQLKREIRALLKPYDGCGFGDISADDGVCFIDRMRELSRD